MSASSTAAEQNVDISEHGADGQTLDRRLYVQLMVFDIEAASGPRAMAQNLARRLSEKRIPSVIYEDVNDHRGLGLLVWSEDPTFFLTNVRPLLGAKRFGALTPRPGWVMLGRTYASGHEAELEHWLVERPAERALDADARWSIWYPLRRNGAFARLDSADRAAIGREHGALGRAYAEAGLVQDIRLACAGLDPEDNDFVLGLLGADLAPLSKVVEAMRATRQTSEFIEKLGPFFVGRKAYQHPAPRREPEPEPEPAAPEADETVDDSPVDTAAETMEGDAPEALPEAEE